MASAETVYNGRSDGREISNRTGFVYVPARIVLIAKSFDGNTPETWNGRHVRLPQNPRIDGFRP